MNSLIEPLIGQRVVVWTAGQFKDRGVLDAYEEPWLRLRNGSEVVLLCTRCVRSINPEVPEGHRREDETESLPIPADAGKR